MFVRNFLAEPKWIPGTVVTRNGPVSLEVELINGKVVCRHIDQVLICKGVTSAFTPADDSFVEDLPSSPYVSATSQESSGSVSNPT